ncbi:MAG: BTAD domain-containing putative transcriptional regulator [Acidimicrobiales bacterium]
MAPSSPSPGAVPVVRIRLAGRVEVVDAGGRSTSAGLGRLGRVALAYLVTQRHRPVPRHDLAEVLWEEDLPRSWETSLRGLVSRLRGVLAEAGVGPGALVTASSTYSLVLPPGTSVDLEEAAAALARARAALDAGHPAAAAADAATAAEMAARPFLADAGGRWVEHRQAELRDLRLRALELVAEAAVAAGQVPDAVAAAEEAVSLEPLRESASVRLMAAHAAAGNRGEALRAYERCRRTLAEELGVHPSPPTEAAYLALLGAEAAPAPPSPGSDPGASLEALGRPLSRFVGRHDDVAEVAAMLASARLVTLVGPGGVGKTRLAAEVVAAAGNEALGRVHVAPLAGVTDSGLVAGRVLAAAGGREQAGADATAALVEALAEAPALVVLDNCEHVVDGVAPLVDRLLRAVPTAAVLATSRQPLGVPGEAIRPVAPLGVPGPGDRTAAAVARSEAAQLLAARVAAVRPGWSLTDVEAEAAARICRRLDGLPLALELAAARARALSLADIADRLDDRFRFLTGGPRTVATRHQALRAAVDGSWEGLGPHEQATFSRLSTFAGGFDLEAAERVAAGPPVAAGDVVGLVAGLVNKSLVVADVGAGPGRYRLLETLRHYAADRLAERGETDTVAARHLAWATALAEDAEAGLDGPDPAAALRRLEVEHDNLRAALARAATRDPGAALALAASLGRFWELRGHLSEGRTWLDAALTAAVDAGPAQRAAALTAAAVLAGRQGDAAAARARHEEALVIRRALGDEAGIAVALHGLGNLAAQGGRLDEARRLFADSLAAGRALPSLPVIVASLSNLGWVAHRAGDAMAARAAWQEGLAACRSTGDHRGVAVLLADLAELALAGGDHAGARLAAAESLALRRGLGDRPGVADSLATLGRVALEEGHTAEARRLLDESVALRRDLGDRPGLAEGLADRGEVARVDGDLAEARALLDEAVDTALDLGDAHCATRARLRLGVVSLAAGDPAGAVGALEAARPPPGGRPDAAAAEWLEGLAAVAASGGGHRRSARLLGAAAATRAAVGRPVPPYRSAGLAALRAAGRAALGDDRWGAAFEAGRAAPDPVGAADLALDDEA